MSTREDRIAGVLAGQACGDALGAPVEFGPPGSQAGFGRGVFGHAPGQFTDDTEQAVCVALARSEPLEVARLLLDWFHAGPLDVGGQTASVLGRCRTAADVPVVARAYGERKASLPPGRGMDPGSGNGALMRTGPVCLPFLGNREQIAAAAREISDLTHCTPHDGDAAVLWSLAVSAAICSEEPIAFNAIGELVRAGLEFIPESRRDYWAAAIREACSAHPSRFNPNGGAIGAFKAALSSVVHNTTYEGVIRCCVAIGGDTDTTSAIAGALAGALYGASAIPAEWTEVIHGIAPGGVVLDADGLCALALEAAGIPVS